MIVLSNTARAWAAYANVVRNPRFFPLWLGQLVSNLGDTLNYIALVIIVFRITGSGTALALVSIFQIVPVITVSLVAGVVIDRVSRKVIMVGADVVRGLLVLLLIVADQTNQVVLVYVAATLLAAVGSFFRPALQAIIPSLLDEDELLAANSVAWSTEQLVQIVGAAVAGSLILWAGPSIAFAVNACSFFFSAALLARLPIPAVEKDLSGHREPEREVLASFAADLRGGLAYTRQTPLISRLFIVQLLASLAVGGTSALLVVLSSTHLHLMAAGFSLLLLAIGVGALVGPFILNVMRFDIRNPQLLFIPYLVRGVGDILIALLTPLPIAALLLFVYGLSTSTGMVTYNSFMQASVPDRLRGRVYTLFDLSWSVMEITSLAISGWLNDQFGIQAVYYLGGGLLIVAGSLGLGLISAHPKQSEV